MGKALTDFAYGVANQAAGGLVGQVFAKSNDKRQLKQAKKLQDLEMAGQKQMTEYNYQKQLQMWKDTNYSAQMEQLKLAELNPGLIYGMSGGGGATTNIETGKVSGNQAPTGGGENVAMAGQMAQMALLKAQKDNIEAQTEKTKAETANTQTGTELSKLELAFNQETYEDRTDEIYYEAQEQMYKTGIAEQQEGQLKDQRPDALRKLHEEGNKVKAEAIGALLANEKTKADTKLSEEQKKKIQSDIAVNNATISKWVEEVSQGWARLTYEERKTKVAELAQEIEGKRFIFESGDRIWNKVMDVVSLGRRGKK